MPSGKQSQSHVPWDSTYVVLFKWQTSQHTAGYLAAGDTAAGTRGGSAQGMLSVDFRCVDGGGEHTELSRWEHCVEQNTGVQTQRHTHRHTHTRIHTDRHTDTIL